MSTFTIDNTLQNIIYNGFDVQRLIFNDSLVWERGSQPTPQPVELIDPYETVPNRKRSSQSSIWNYNCTETYNQFNFIDTQLCTAQELLDYDYGNARIIRLHCPQTNQKKISSIDYIKINEWLTSEQAQSLYSAISNASNPNTWSSSLESTIREWYKSQRTAASYWYYTQIRDAWYATANIMIYNDSKSTPDIRITNSNGTQYNIDDIDSANLGYNYKVKLNYDTTTTSGVYYPSVPNSSVGLAASPFILLTSWTNLFKMLYNEYYLKKQSL